MKYLCLICAETLMEQMPEADAEKHYEEYGEFTEGIKRSATSSDATGCCPPMPRPRSGCGRAGSRPRTGPLLRPRNSLAATTSSRPGI